VTVPATRSASVACVRCRSCSSTRALQDGGLTEARPVPWEVDRPEGFDVAEFLALHPTDGKKQLIERCKQAAPWTPPSSTTVSGERPIPTSERREADAFEPEAVLVNMADVQIEPVEWLWPQRLARGKLHNWIGDPGMGKSMLSLDVAARISTGRPFPDGAPTSIGSVVFIAAEDGLGDTMKPRLQAYGADMGQIHVLEAVRFGEAEHAQRGISLERDIAILERAIAKTGAVLVVIDPITSYLGNSDSYKDPEVRRILLPLVDLGKRTGVAVLMLQHITKEMKAKALNRAQGSMAFIAVPRIVMAVGPDPSTPNPYERGSKRVLAPLKQNICAPADAWDFTITSEPSIAGAPARVAWGSRRPDLQADAVLAGTPYRDAEARQDVETFLREQLRDGEWHLQTDIERAAEAASLTPSRLRRTREKICDTQRIGFGGKWYWRLKPQASPDSPIDGSAPITPPPGDIYGENGTGKSLPSITSSLMSPGDIYGAVRDPLTSMAAPASGLDDGWEKI
jgi:hypothetical protein